MLAAQLAYVTLIVSDSDAAATVLQRDFGLTRSECTLGASGSRVPVLHVGDSALVLVEPRDPFVQEDAYLGVHHIALGVADVSAAANVAVTAGVAIAEPATADGVNGGLRLCLDPVATAGVKTHVVECAGFDTAAAHGDDPPLAGGMRISHQQTRRHMVQRLDHIGVASADNAMAIDTFANRLGFAVESTQTDTEVQIAVESFTSDKYGVVYHNRPAEPVGGLRVAFITIGDCELEFLQDFDPRPETHVAHGQAGTTRQDRGAIARYVSSRGPGLHHLAFKVSDADSALEALQEAGHTLIDTVGRPGSRRSHIGFVHPKSLYGVLLHVVQRDEV
ncbi:MAG: VOC family protein [Candidatus Tectomicrobia bacterium]|nr:VOC family protein [Candidatus Tectomicrobia bacterium]